MLKKRDYTFYFRILYYSDCKHTHTYTCTHAVISIIRDYKKRLPVLSSLLRSFILSPYSYCAMLRGEPCEYNGGPFRKRLIDLKLTNVKKSIPLTGILVEINRQCTVLELNLIMSHCVAKMFL